MTTRRQPGAVSARQDSGAVGRGGRRLAPSSRAPVGGKVLGEVLAEASDPARPARPRLPVLQAGVGVFLLALLLLAGIGLLASAGALVWQAGAGVELAALTGLLVAVRALGVSRGVLRYAERLVSHDATFRLLERIRVWFHGRLVAAGPVAVGRLHSADLLERVVADVELLQELPLRAVAPAAAAVLVTVAVTGLLLVVDPLSALLVLALLVVGGAVVPGVAMRAGRAPAARQAAARSALRRGIVEGLGAWREASLFGRGDAVRAEIMREVDALAAVEAEDAAVAGVDGVLHALVVGAAAIALLVRASVLLGAGEIAPALAAALVFGVLVVFEAVQSLPAAFWHVERSRSALRRLEADGRPEGASAGRLEADGEGREQAAARAQEEDVALPPGGGSARSLVLRAEGLGVIGVEGVRLQEVTFCLRTGERLIVTGPSGSGKSSLVRGLVGLERRCGTLTLCGSGLAGEERTTTPGGAGAPEGVASAPLRARFAVLPQEVHLMRASLAENLRIADPGASDEVLRGVLHEVGLAPILAAMPEGLATELGEAGSRLSGGERRRLGLARLLLRVRRTTGPMVLLLDEPTAHLDGDASEQVWELLDRLRADHAQLVVSHRSIPLRPGDRVLMLEGGQAVEQGEAEQLLAAGGAFAALRAHQEGELRFAVGGLPRIAD